MFLSLIKEDFPRKFTAILFAVIIWYAVYRQFHDIATFRDIPVHIEGTKSQVILSYSPHSITVRVKGAKKRLQKMSNIDIKVNLELDSDIPTTYHLPIEENNITLPYGMSVLDIKPSRIIVNTDVYISKDVPVRVETRGKLSSGFEYIKSSVIPAQVKILGPSKIINEIIDVTTEPIFLDQNVISDFEIYTKLIQKKNIETMTPSSVSVAVEIAEVSATRGLTNLPITTLNKEESILYSVVPLPTVNITIKGRKKILETLDKNSVRPFVDISSFKNPGEFTCPVQVWIGESGINAEYIHPMVVAVKLAEIEACKTEKKENNILKLKKLKERQKNEDINSYK
ncbi:MAG: CdaR family protein [Verrucomicrobiota bacterium]|nr:CdaR family protein [Verrucomicrobiota bacterium]